VNTSTRYKPIELQLSHALTKKENNVIDELEHLFPRTDFFFEKKPSSLLFHVNQLDVSAFQTMVQDLTKKHHLSSPALFTELLTLIDDIKSYGVKNKKRLYVDYNLERKVRNRKQKETERGMFFYARDHEFNPENNTFPQEFTNKIICGDSEEVLKHLPENSVDLIFTSPPYNFGLAYESSPDGIDWNQYLDKLYTVFTECIRVLKYGGRIVVNVQPLFSDYIPLHHLISQFFMDQKLIWKGEILWEKSNYNCKYTAWGSWKSPSNPYLKYTWEFLEIFCKGDLKKEGKRDHADITDEEFKKWVVAKWNIAPEKNMNNYGHPAMFPEELAQRVMKLFSFEHDVVLDPFNGVGTTTLVARQLNRNYLGIDISEEYCKKADKRLNSTRKKK